MTRAETLKVPTGQLDWWVGSFHVSTSDVEIAQGVQRLVRWGKAPFSRDFMLACVEHALKSHRAGQKLYRDVMRGRI